jgi:hypothetical protein
MKIMVRALCISGLVLATLWLAGCGHYTCGATFGNSTCSSSGGGLNQGNGGNPTGDAYIYVADAGGVQGLTMNVGAGTIVQNCTPSTCPQVPNVASEAAAIAQEKFLYVDYPTTGNIYGWTIAADGSLASITGVFPLQISDMVGSVAGGTQAMVTNPAGTLLFVANTLGILHVYQIGSAGGLVEAPGSPLFLPSGFEPFNLAMDGLGKYLYVSNIVGGSTTTEILGYSVGSTGGLSAVTGSPFLASVNSQFALMQMQGDGSGKYLIGTSGGVITSDLHLYVLAIQSNGSIAPVAGSPFATASSPSDVAVQPNSGGTLVYSMSISGSFLGNQIEGYTLNVSTGALGTVSGSPFSVLGGFGLFDQSGTYLFVVENPEAATTVMDVYKVSGSSTLTTPVASVGWGQGAWAPTDIP